MRRSRAEIYLHLVWSTRDRTPLLTSDIERAICRCIEGEAKGLGCDVLAIGGTDDHVHLVVKTPTTVNAATLAHQVKGVSSHFAHEQLRAYAFGWQAGYGVFSVSRPHLRDVIRYVEHQKERHAAGKTWAQWEETDEEVGDEDRRTASSPAA